MLALVLLAGLIGRVLADEAKGKIKSVRPAVRTLVLDISGKDLALEVHPKAKITLSGKAGTLMDLKNGDPVTVHYDKQGEKTIATAIVRP